MSCHVYIARSGFRDTPLSRDEWARALRAQHRLRVVEKRNRRGTSAFIGRVPGDGSRQISLTPDGVAHVQDPPREMVEGMFALASLLDGGVYSEKLKRYASPAAWEESTRSYRMQLRARRQEAARMRRRRLLAWLVLLVASLALGWHLGS